MKKFKLVSDVVKLKKWLWFTFSYVEIRISTVKLPDNYGYETCIFYQNDILDSEVVQHYETLADAIEGHSYWATKLGAKKAEMDLTSTNVVV